MTTQQPEALAQECADYATSLRSAANVAKLEGRAPPVSFLRAADLFERAASRITGLESQLAQSFDAADVATAAASGFRDGVASVAPPTAQAEGWRSMETAPRDGTEVLANTAGLGRAVVYWDDEEHKWGTGLGYLDRGAPTHWMPLPPPPTSAEGVEHG